MLTHSNPLSMLPPAFPAHTAALSPLPKARALCPNHTLPRWRTPFHSAHAHSALPRLEARRSSSLPRGALRSSARAAAASSASSFVSGERPWVGAGGGGGMRPLQCLLSAFSSCRPRAH